LLRKTGIRYADLHPNARVVRAAFIAAMSPQAWLAVLDTWYDPHRDWPPSVRRTGPADLIAAGAK
jgi:hypothetical protein